MTDLEKLFNAAAPGEMLQLWYSNGFLAAYLPEVACLFGVPQNPAHHPEVDTGIHTMMCLDIARQLSAKPEVMFAVMVHDLGKGLTPANELPKHIDHELRGIEPVQQLCERLNVPEYWRKLALLVCEFHLKAHQAFILRSKSILQLLNETGMEFDHVLLDDFLNACEADKRGRLGKENSEYMQGQYIRQVAQAIKDIPMSPGTRIESRESQELHRARLEAVRTVSAPFKQAIDDAKSALVPS